MSLARASETSDSIAVKRSLLPLAFAVSIAAAGDTEVLVRSFLRRPGAAPPVR